MAIETIEQHRTNEPFIRIISLLATPLKQWLSIVDFHLIFGLIKQECLHAFI